MYPDQLQREVNQKDCTNQSSCSLYDRLLFPLAKADTFVETTEVACLGNITTKAFSTISVLPCLTLLLWLAYFLPPPHHTFLYHLLLSFCSSSSFPTPALFFPEHFLTCFLLKESSDIILMLTVFRGHLLLSPFYITAALTDSWLLIFFYWHKGPLIHKTPKLKQQKPGLS